MEGERLREEHGKATAAAVGAAVAVESARLGVLVQQAVDRAECEYRAAVKRAVAACVPPTAAACARGLTWLRFAV